MPSRMKLLSRSGDLYWGSFAPAWSPGFYFRRLLKNSTYLPAIGRLLHKSYIVESAAI